MVTALNIANNFLERSFDENIRLSSMKIQRLIYILYRKYLKQTGYKLFSENFEAWQYGPVLPNVYCEFQNFKADSITCYALNSDYSVTKVEMKKGTAFYDIFHEVWENYKHYSGVALSNFICKENGAWQKSINNKTYVLNDFDIEIEED